MNYNRDLCKGVVKTAVSISVGSTIGRLVSANTPSKNKTQEVEVKVGCFALGGMIGAAAESYVDRQYDAVENTVLQLKSYFVKTGQK